MRSGIPCPKFCFSELPITAVNFFFFLKRKAILGVFKFLRRFALFFWFCFLVTFVLFLFLFFVFFFFETKIPAPYAVPRFC